MKLYFHPISTYSQKALIALYEKNVSFDKEIVDLLSPEAAATWKKTYPLGKVPVLVDGDAFVPESTIVIEYLETKVTGGPRLIPNDPELARKVRFHDRTSDLYLTDPTATLFFDTIAPPDRKDPGGVAKARETLDITFRHLDKILATRTFIVGEAFSMADCATAPALGYLRQLHPFTAYPNLLAYAARLAERPSVRRVVEEAQPYLAKIMSK